MSTEMQDETQKGAIEELPRYEFEVKEDSTPLDVELSSDGTRNSSNVATENSDENTKVYAECDKVINITHNQATSIGYDSCEKRVVGSSTISKEGDSVRSISIEECDSSVFSLELNSTVLEGNIVKNKSTNKSTLFTEFKDKETLFQFGSSGKLNRRIIRPNKSSKNVNRPKNSACLKSMDVELKQLEADFQKLNMASYISPALCDICEIRNRTNHAIKWCPECDEKLCDECYGHHSVTKISRNHAVIDIEQYRKLPQSILAVKNNCHQHDMKFTHLCRQHDALCCPACTSETGDHGKCSTLVLQEVIKTAKTSVSLQSLEETLEKLQGNLRTIIDDRKTNLQNLQDQKSAILLEVNQIKEKIVEHLNAFEKSISEELDQKTKKTEISSLEERLQEAEKIFDELNTMKEYGSDLQTFIGSKLMGNEVNKLNNNLQELVNNGNMERIFFKMNQGISDVSEKMSSLRSILEEKSPMDVALLPEKGTQAQLMSSPSDVPIEEINIMQKTTFQIPGSFIHVYGCTVFQNTKTVFADYYNKTLILFKETGKMEKVIPTSSRPYDVTTIDENTVAVSTNDGVEVINVTTDGVEKKIKLGECNGLEYYKGSLYCCAPGKGVLSVDLSTSTTTTVVQDKRNGEMYYCTVYNDRIYTTWSSLHVVSCYTMGGDKVWEEYKDPSVINCPRDISVDTSSNVYIASYNTQSIVVLSPDGQKHKTLLTEKDGIEWPNALHFDRSTNQLIVGNLNGPGFKFTL